MVQICFLLEYKKFQCNEIAPQQQKKNYKLAKQKSTLKRSRLLRK